MKNPIIFDTRNKKYFVWITKLGVEYMKYFKSPDEAVAFIKININKCVALKDFQEPFPYEDWLAQTGPASEARQIEKSGIRRKDRESRPGNTMHSLHDNEKSVHVILTTSVAIAGRSVIREIEIVTSECVFGMNIFKDMFAGIRDVFGGRSESTQKVLKDARVKCLDELKREAACCGADAVIAVSLNYSEFSGGGKSMLFLVASGTAVKLNGPSSGKPEE